LARSVAGTDILNAADLHAVGEHDELRIALILVA
jgi:hypothetical protein